MQARRLCRRDVRQRRASADRFVVVPHFGDELGRRRPPAAHQAQVSGISSSDDGVPWAIRRTAEVIAVVQWPGVGGQLQSVRA